MEDIAKIIPDHDQFDNYMSVLIGLSVTVDGLQGYVKTSLQTLLNEIQDRYKAMHVVTITVVENSAKNSEIGVMHVQHGKTT